MLKGMQNSLFSAVLLAIGITFLSSCASSPKASTAAATDAEAKAWLNQYCSSVSQHSSAELFGSLIMRARTEEFKGQYPATLHYDRSGAFQLEVTNILGGTLVQLLGDAPGANQALEIKSPAKPRYNRQGITHYLGLEVSVLTQLLHGDLPCPSLTNNTVTAEGSKLVIQTPNWKWVFTRATAADQEVPVDVQLIPVSAAIEGKIIDMQIKDWDHQAHYAKKVYLKTPEGEILWSWRSREQK
jgi:hypothetical protein